MGTDKSGGEIVKSLKEGQLFRWQIYWRGDRRCRQLWMSMVGAVDQVTLLPLGMDEVFHVPSFDADHAQREAVGYRLAKGAAQVWRHATKGL